MVAGPDRHPGKHRLRAGGRGPMMTHRMARTDVERAKRRSEIEARVGALSDEAQAACIEALKIVQRHRGWVSDESTARTWPPAGHVARRTRQRGDLLQPDFRKPVGRHVILLCDSVSCWIMGYDARARAPRTTGWASASGETTADGRFTLLPIVCLGACDHAPGHDDRRRPARGCRPGQLDAILEQCK